MLHMCVQVFMRVVDRSLHSATGRLLAGGEGWEGGGQPQDAAPPASSTSFAKFPRIAKV
jgi:hypothetical protein